MGAGIVEVGAWSGFDVPVRKPALAETPLRRRRAGPHVHMAARAARRPTTMRPGVRTPTPDCFRQLSQGRRQHVALLEDLDDH